MSNEQARENDEAQGPERSGEAPIRIVLADDHAVVRSGLRLLLDSEPDFEVVAEAGDVDAASATCAGITRRCSCST